MPALPDFGPSKTSVAIDEALEAEQVGRHGYRIPASKAADPCDRALWYSLRWASPIKRHSGQLLRIFESGNIYETRLLNYLRKSGLDVVDHEGFDAEGKSKQIGVSFSNGHGYGKLDAEVFKVLDAPTKWHVAELKSHNDKSFNRVLSMGVQKAKPEHYGQTQLYMHKRGRSRGLYVYTNKNDDRIETERIEYDADYCIRLEVRCERIAFSDWAPARIANDPERWPCMFCDHKELCHNEGAPENNCRTCLHIDARPDGVWHCTRHRVDLTRKEQEQGCSLHLFLPSLIPGEQINSSARDGWVEYQMRDGSIWRDGA